MSNGQYITHGFPTPFIVSETGQYQYIYNGTVVDETSGGTSYTLALSSGTYSYTGTAETLNAFRSLSLGSGSYSYTGHTSSFGVKLSESLAGGTYSYTGSQIGMTYTPSGGGAVTLPHALYHMHHFGSMRSF